MELAQLRYFLKIVEHKNFTRAAKACQVSQPALSQQMAKLEKEFGPIFERQGRKIRLTETGRILRINAEEILQLVEKTYRQIQDNGTSGRVVISTVSTIGPFYTTKLIHSLVKQFPDAKIQLSEESPETLVNRCTNGEVDFAIASMTKTLQKRLTCEPILQEEIQAVVSVTNPLAQKSQLSIEDLRDQPLIMMVKRQCLTQCVEEFLNDHGLTTDNVVARVEQFSTLQHLVAMGNGISFVPRMAVNPKFKTSLCYLPLAEQDLHRTIAVCWSEKRFQNQLAANMIKAIREISDPNLIDPRPEIPPPKSKLKSRQDETV